MTHERTRARAPDGAPWLRVARVVWVLVSLLAVGLFLAGIPPYFAQSATVCTGSALQCSESGLLSAAPARELEGLGATMGAYALYNVVLDVVFAVVWCGTGLVVFLRRSDDPMALLASLTLVTFGSFQGTQAAVTLAFPILGPLTTFVALSGFASIILLLYLFPDGRFRPGWMAVPALVWILNDAVSLLAPNLYGQGSLATVGFLAFFVPAACALGSQTYRYRRTSDPVERQQTKWVVFGLVGTFGGYLLLISVQGLYFGFEDDSLVSVAFFDTVRSALFLLIPLSIGVAVTRSRLWNIDVLINQTLVYGLLSLSLALLYAGSVVVLQATLRPIAGGESQVAVVASTLAIAALFNPLRYRIQALIDRRFYRDRYDARRTLASLAARLRDETDLDALCADLTRTTTETVRPAHVSVWLQAAGAPDAGKEST